MGQRSGVGEQNPGKRRWWDLNIWYTSVDRICGL